MQLRTTPFTPGALGNILQSTDRTLLILHARHLTFREFNRLLQRRSTPLAEARCAANFALARAATIARATMANSVTTTNQGQHLTCPQITRKQAKHAGICEHVHILRVFAPSYLGVRILTAREQALPKRHVYQILKWYGRLESNQRPMV
jgi:hypothetical protein